MKRNLPNISRAVHHTIVCQRDRDGTGIPILYLSENIDNKQEALRIPLGLMEYLRENRAYSLQWKRITCRSIGLFYDYLRQRREYVCRSAEETSAGLHRLLLTEFVRDLRLGTIRNLHISPDPTGLNWEPSSSRERVVELIRALDDYLTWLHNHGDRRALESVYSGSSPDGPPSYTSGEAIRFLYAAKYAKKFSLLAHLPSSRERRLRPPSAGQLEREAPVDPAVKAKRFPIRWLPPLIIQGFEKDPSAERPLDRYDVTGRLAATLLAGSGIRSSELFHIWVSDFAIETEEPQVFLRDPIRALVKTEEGALVTRQDYLLRHFQMDPRNMRFGTDFAGWKGMDWEGNYWSKVWWLPIEGLKEAFMELAIQYLRDVRPRLMEARFERGLGDHPYLFVSNGSARHEPGDESVGDPYTRSAWRSSWKRAFRRLQHLYPEDDLVPRKYSGTTPHGLRHLYGGTLGQLGISKVTLKKLMHHRDIRATELYSVPEHQEAHRILSEFATRLRDAKGVEINLKKTT